jgi:pimeloyl-ACP methyl ester carboxylesterase
VNAPVRIVATLGGLYLVYAGVVYLAQRSLLYPGRSRAAPDDAAMRAAGARPFRLPIRGGEVEAWYLAPVPARTTRGPAALWFHGNGELVDDWPPLVEDIRGLGVGVMLVGYPGYGRSSGKPSEATIGEAAIAAYDRLAARDDVDPARIVAVGRSLGAGAACIVAHERRVGALVLLSAFTSVRPFARHYFVPGFLAADVFDNAGVLASYEGPTLLLHGRFDDVVPYSHGEALARVSSRAQLVTFECAHNDFPFERLAEIVGPFLREAGVLASR